MKTVWLSSGMPLRMKVVLFW